MHVPPCLKCAAAVSPTLRSSRRKRATGVFALLLLFIAGSALANDPPVVANATVTPSSVPYLGGVVTISAQVSDDSLLLNDVFVEVIGPYNLGAAALSQSSDGFEWFGTFELPANFTPKPVSWNFYVHARDAELAETVGNAGAVKVDAEPAVDEPPSVADPAVTPRILPNGGGSVTLAVSATDLFGISQTYATVTGPRGATTVVMLNPAGNDRFTGIFNAPVNPGLLPVLYSVEMTALDNRSQPTTVDAGFITVFGTTGQLRVAQNSLSFENVKVGSRASKNFVLHNDGKKSTAPITGLLVAPGAPFFLVGGTSIGIPFILSPGETKSYTVEFRPTMPGVRTATVAVRRTDTAQPGLAVPLLGRAVAPK